MPNSLLTKVAIALRFTIFGVGGFLLMMVTWVSSLDRIIHQQPGPIWQLLLMVVAGGLGAAFMLFGVGEWGKWAYLLVFLTIPLSMLLLFLPFFPHDKLAACLVPAGFAASSYLLAKRYYSHRQSTTP